MILNAIDATVLADQHWDGPGAWWPVFPLLWFLFVATLLFVFVRTGRRRSWQSGLRAGERRLAERYASGEIDDDEYARRLATLRTANGR
jgi:putative membrane protein